MKSSSIIVISAVLIVLAFIVGFMIGKGSTALPSPDVSTSTVTDELREVTKFNVVRLTEQSDSGQIGIATITEEEGKAKVSINVVGEPDDASQPAHIHAGQCPTPGAVAYPLTNVVDGDSETILNVSYDDLMAKKPLAINLHKSAAESNVYVDCGNV